MKTVVFDMYGVIMEDPNGELLPFLRRYNPDIDVHLVYSAWIRAALGELSSNGFFREIGLDNIKGIEEAYLSRIKFDRSFPRYAGLIKEKYRLALLSNDLSEWNSRLRKEYDLDRYFDCVIVSGDVGLKKPDPAIYRLLLGALSQPPSDCIAIDDRAVNLSAANDIGMDTILFDRNRSAYRGKSVGSFKELFENHLKPYENDH